MKKSAYIQLGLVLVALALYVSQTRERFPPGITDAKCPNGSAPPMSDFKCADTGNRPTCPEGSLLYMVFSRDAANPKLSCVPSNLIYEGQWPDGPRTQNPCRSQTDSAGLHIPATGSPPAENPKCINTSTGESEAASGTTSGTTSGSTSGTTSGSTTTTNGFEDVTSKFRQLIDSLRPFRPPTAPASDLEKERKEITDIAKQNMFYVQVALFLVVLAMLSFFVFPLDTANLIAFALLCVGIAMGFFLRR